MQARMTRRHCRRVDFDKFSHSRLFRAVTWLVIVSLVLAQAPVPTRAQVSGTPASASASSLSIGNYTLVSSTRVSRTLFDFVYRATLTNAGSNPVPGVTATLTSTSAATTVIDNRLTFGVIPAGAGLSGSAAVVSQDTFTIRQDRTLPFNPATLVWTLNQHPQANAGPDQTVKVGATMSLDGSASSDLDGDELTFQWTLLTKPANSTAALSSTTAVEPTFVVDQPGTYEIRLIVNDGLADSLPDTVVITTENSAPVADAGPDQTVPLGSTVTLDGTGSHDPDHDPLTFQWSFESIPQASTATLTNATTATPSFIVDKPGAYHVRLVVDDGKVASAEDIVIVSTENSAPVANAGPDLEGVVNQAVQLDGSGSSDVDGGALSYQWSFVTVPDASTAVLSDTTLVNPMFTPDVAGMYVVQLIVNDGKLNSAPDSAKITITVSGGGGCTPGATEACYSGPAGTQGVGICKAGSKTCAADGTFGACQGEVVPTTEILNNGLDEDCNGQDLQCTPGSTQACYSGPAGTEGIGICKAGIRTCSEAGTFGSCAGQVLPGTEISNNGIDEDCNGADQTTGGGGLPPDPATIAPPINQSVATTVAAATAFLYTGANPIQTGVADGTIDAKRAAVLRGKVLDKNNNPLPGVTISILNHSEFGQTLSRADGMFDLAVNGGGLLVVNYVKAGLLPAQRQVQIPWQDYVLLPDAMLIPLDSAVTQVDLTAPGMKVAQGSVSTDGDGTRRAALLFPQGTQAEMMMPDGSIHAMSTLAVRATEYTVGSNGPTMMPAELPPSSAYTYAVELSADEALAAGAAAVRFSQPLIQYVENFLGFPVGAMVPAGYYDRQKGQWISSTNGLVIKILAVSNGLAEVDTNDDGTADDATRLASWGITDAERQRLATLYQPGQSLWRVPIPHFTPWDYNFPYGLPKDAKNPNGNNDGDGGDDDPCEQNGSTIECENQILGEDVNITGTLFTLHYRSDRVEGRKANRTLKINLSDSSIPASLRRIHLEVWVAGRRFTQTFNPAPNLTTSFTWDGLDVYGRPIQGKVPVTTRVGYEYPLQYYATKAEFQSSFANTGMFGRAIGGGGGGGGGAGLSVLDFNLVGSRAATSPVIVWQTRYDILGPWDVRAVGLGGWTLDVHHTYDPSSKVLYLGNRRRRSAAVETQATAKTLAGSTTTDGFAGDGGQADKALFGVISSVALAPDGSYYIADIGNNRVRRVGTDGIVTTVAGNGSFGRGGDGGPATDAQFSGVYGLAVGPDGSVYIADSDFSFESGRIRKLGTDGKISTVAGGGVSIPGDGGPATSALLDRPVDVAVGPDGSLYIAERRGPRVRRVGPDGVITTVAGVGSLGGIDGNLATAVSLQDPTGVALARDGSLYIADRYHIYRVGLDGIITTLAGCTGAPTCPAQLTGVPATTVSIVPNGGIAVGPDGSVYFGEAASSRARRVGPEGIITTVAGVVGTSFVSAVLVPDGDPATSGLLSPQDIAIGPDGNVYVASAFAIRRIAPALPGFAHGDFLIAARDGGEVYIFNKEGRHLQTLDALTNAVRYQFTYDSASRLSSITDVAGNVTTIEHDANGNPTAIVSPYGQRTTLTVNTDGYLAEITNPANETFQIAYTSDGLLTSFTGSRGNTSQMTYDSLGRLLRDTDPAGGFQDLALTELNDGREVVRKTALDRTTRYHVQTLPNGDRQRTNTFPDGSQAQALRKIDGASTTTFANGIVVNTQQGGDPRFGMQAPVQKSRTVTTPGGLTQTITNNRTVSLSDSNNPLSLQTLTDTINVNGRTYTRVYNAATRTFTLTTPASRQHTATLDAKGRIIQAAVGGLTPVQLSYDSRGRVGSLSHGSRAYAFAYDNQGFLSLLTGPLTHTLSFARDAVGRTTVLTRPAGENFQFAYDANGNMISLTPPGRSAHTFDFTSVDLLQSYEPPALGGNSTDVQIAYNLDRQLTQLVRAGANVTVNYDGAGRVQSLTFPQDTVSATYNANGRLQTLATASGIGLAYSYDGSLLTDTTWTGPVTGTIHRTFDNNFRLTSRTINRTNAQNFTYDADGLLTQAGALTLQRDAQNDLVTGTALGVVSDTRSFDTFGEWTNYSATAGAAPLFSTQYTYDQGGRITQKSETIGGVATTLTYNYDLVGRLSEVKQNGTTTATYTYDANGNRLSRTTGGGTTSYTYDAQDRLLTQSSVLGTQSYAYTTNGDLQSKTVGSQTTTYSYDVLGNLRSMTLPSSTQIEYLIDGRNRRVGKKVNGTQVQGFLYQDRLEPIAELDGNNAIVSTFVYGSRPNTPDYMVKGGTTYRIIADHLGSPRLVVDTATGAIAQRLDYDEFGQVIQDTNPGFQPFGFAGGLYDQHTKLTRFGARDYDAEAGRWTAKDSILFNDRDTNLYGYVQNDPVNFIDPTGKFVQAVLLIQPALIVTEAALITGAIYTGALVLDRLYNSVKDIPGQSYPPGEDGATEYPDVKPDTEFPGGGTCDKPVIPKNDPLPTKDIFPPDAGPPGGAPRPREPKDTILPPPNPGGGVEPDY